MNTEQDRADFEAWAKADGYEDFERFGEGYAHPELREAWRAYKAGRAALQSQPQETIAYVTRNEEGDPAMLFFDLKEARLYCNPDEEPEALVLAGSALQSQDAEDAAEWLKQHEALMHRVSKAAIVVGYSGEGEAKLMQAEKALIDHARRIEGDGE